MNIDQVVVVVLQLEVHLQVVVLNRVVLEDDVSGVEVDQVVVVVVVEGSSFLEKPKGNAPCHFVKLRGQVGPPTDGLGLRGGPSLASRSGSATV